MNSGKIRFVLVLSAFLLLFSFTSCSKSSGKKCVEDKECGYGAYCSVEEGKEKGKCADFAEGDYKIEITSLEDGAHVCGKITVEVALSEVSEKLHDGMEAALTVAKDRDMQTLTGAFSENAISFEIDLAEKGEYKLAAFLIQNPYFRAEVTLTCDSEPEPEDDTDTNTPDEDNTEPVDDGDTDTPVDDADSESVDDDADTDTEPEEATPVATITSHPQDVSSVATAEFTFESDIEEATFRCKLDANEWESCTSPKVYENLTEGDHKFSLKAVNVGGTESEVVSFSWKIDFTIANIEILAPWNSDKAGNGDADTCKANNYGAIVKDGTIYVGTTQDALDGKNYGVCFKVGVKNTVVNAKFEVYSKNGETWNPLFTGKIEDGEIENGVMLNGLALSEGANTLKVVVGGKSEDVPDAEYVQKIVVATESPAISWAFPPKDHKFLQSNFSSGIFATFNITGSIPGLEIELVEGDSTVASLKTGKLGAESLSFVNPELADSCSPRDFHVVIYDTLNDNTVDSDSRSITFDVNAPSIDSLSVFGKNGIAVHSTVSAAQNPIIVNVNVSDAANTAGDGSREVTLYTNNGMGTPNKVLAGPKSAVGGIVVFENIELSEAKHTIKVEAKDCNGNISSQTLDPVTVSTTNPVLTVVSPKGTGDDWRWLTLADVPELEGASVADGELAGVKMHIVSNKVLSGITQILHTYGSSSVDITENASLSEDGMNIFVDLPNLENSMPDLENAKQHKFLVSVVDFAGNFGKIGGADEEYYGVDVVAPTITSLAFDSDNYPVEMTLVTENIDSETHFTLVATKGEVVKTWNGTFAANGTVKKDLNLSTGEWNATLTLTDNHGNTSAATGSFEVTADVPDIVLKKEDGSIIGVGSEQKPSWFVCSQKPDDPDSACTVSIRIYAPEGTEINYGIGSSTSVTIGAAGFETIKLSLNLFSVSEFAISSGQYNETYYLRATNLIPAVQISNPTACPKSAEYCSIYDLEDDDSTEVIELAEVGFGYDDDLTPGDGILNFKAGSAIKFTVQNSVTGGFMEIENAPEGFEYARVSLVKMQGDAIPENYYSADFSNLTVPDTNMNGQTDYDLVFVLTTDSGIVQKYYVPLHLDLALPAAVSAASSSSDALLGKIGMSWNPASTVDEQLYAYEVRYQSYDEGTCSIVNEFDTATKPLTEYAGNIPAPADTMMTYNFFVNAVTNADKTITADIHKNGNSYCAAVKAVNAVYSYDGKVMAKNFGLLDEGSVKDAGTIKMEWENIYETSSGSHNFRLKIIGDVNNDGFEDYAIADRHKSDSGIDTQFNGFVDIYSGLDHSLIKSIRGALGSTERVGQDISSKADFNNDGFNDFVYTNFAGDVFVFYGTENGIDFDGTPATFRAKDDSNQGYRGLAVGDYDGDGCDDLLISAPVQTVGDYANAGEVYLYYGCKEGGFAEEPDLTFKGNAANAKVGNSGIMDAGDLNGDGKTDFAFGSANALYIVYGGSADGTLSPKIKSLYNPVSYMGTGDFNGDGYSDLVYNHVSSTSAETRIYYGSSSGIRTTADLKINDFSAIYDNYGISPNYNTLAVSLHAKDLNGDGADDLVITSSTGVLIYYTYTDSVSGKKQLKTQPSVFDGFSGQAGLNSKIMTLDDAIIYCNNDVSAGNCGRLNF
ncbi:VCBS repeat-containing protein [bacterium]|nr:VCBS repeat-containing protein [bacterium]